MKKVRTVATTFKHTKSKAVKSAAYDTDINRMVAGQIPFTQSKRAFYIDETLYPDNFEASFNAIAAAHEQFMQLPARIREEFQNSPAALAAALNDSSQHSRLRELGILAPAEEAPKRAPNAGEGASSVPPQGGNPDPKGEGSNESN